MSLLYSVLNWAGFFFVLLSLAAHVNYAKASNRRFFTGPFIILTIMEYYYYFLSLLLSYLFENVSLSETTFCEVSLIFSTIFVFTIILFRRITNEYDFFTRISSYLQLITVISWACANGLFTTFATSFLNFSFHYDNEKIHNCFYIELCCLLLGLLKFWNLAVEIKRENEISFSPIGILMSSLGFSLWIAGIINVAYQTGVIFFIKSLAKCEISFLGLTLSVYLLMKNNKKKQAAYNLY